MKPNGGSLRSRTTERATTESAALAAGSRMGWRLAYLAAAVGIFLVDQSTKAWAVEALKRTGARRRIVDGFLDFAYAENRGIAFGQLQEGGTTGRWLLAGLAVAAATAVLVYLFRTPRADDRLLGACALLLAGITGNLADRIRLGYVIDFIDVHLGSFTWPTFNVADSAICIGALLLAFDLFREGRPESRDEAANGQSNAVSDQGSDDR